MNKKILISIFTLLFTGFLLHYWITGQAVYGDGIYYWMLTRSIGIDHDLRLNNEIAHHYSWSGNNTSEKSDPIPKETDELRKLAFHLPIGPSLFWLPWFFIGHLLAQIVSLFNTNILTNGYSDIYQITVGFGVIVYTIIGIAAMHNLLIYFYSKLTSWLAIIFVLFASTLFYYTSLDILNSHAISFMLSSILVLFLYKFLKKPSKLLSLSIGLLYGLQIITRTQDALFIIGISIIFLAVWKKLKFSYIILFILGTLLTLSPQMLVWHFVFGGFLQVPYTHAEKTFDFFHPHLLGLLINPKTGIVFYSPILLFCMIGAYSFLKKNRTLGLAALLVIISEYYLIASWAAWHQGASYGTRMLISCTPFFILGLANLINSISYKKTIISMGIFLVFINMLAITYFHLFLKDPTFDMGNQTKERNIQKIYKTLRIE